MSKRVGTKGKRMAEQSCSPMGYTTTNKNWHGICTDSLGYIVIAAENGALIWRSSDGGASFSSVPSAGSRSW